MPQELAQVLVLIQGVDLCAVQGVLAYGLNPVRRERLNERFLQSTLRSVGYGEIATSNMVN